MSRATRRITTIFAFAALTACGKTATTPFSSPEKIIGENDMLKVLEDGRKLLKAEGGTASTVQMPQAIQDTIDAVGIIDPIGCTGTHIGNGLVLTAGHCLDAADTPSRDKPCPGTTVRWGFREDKAPYATSECETILAMELNDDRDYAIFKVKNPPRARALVDVERTAPEETKLTILGHPQRLPLQWSQFCVVKDRTNGNWGVDQFSHQCDTLPGNSGSSVWDATTMKIVGIHDGGLAPWNYGTLLTKTPLKEILDRELDSSSN